ncbi:hydroxylysine kinase isoform X2 [Procambarus clarkii]|nr:hydroxylysine kinase-like isoform X2 [Procambarus clarkii]XP_045581933.1 hydroxylysine kinase-like isoform X2 [Procambarus clarkii]
MSASYKGMLQPGQIIRPLVKQSDIPQLVNRIFGLTTVSVKELNSYDDKNFHIKVESTINNPHIKEIFPNGYVLKILNSMDSMNEKLVDAQNEAMLFLHSRGFNVPEPQKNIHGTFKTLERFSMSSDELVKNNVNEQLCGLHIVRLLTFIEGKILHQVPYTAELSFECGAYIAKLDNELKDFPNEDLKLRKFLWMLDSIPELSKYVYAVKDEKCIQLVQEILEAWKLNVMPEIPGLEKGVLHGDFNEQNIIVNAKPCEPITFHIDGLLDFGDMQYSCYLFEIAIGIMYQMVDVKCMPPSDAGGYMLAGYLTQRSLSETEWNILKECVAARFAQSLVMGAYSYDQDPGNEYLLITAAKGWDILFHFWNTPKEDIISHWKKIIKSYKNKN